ncbi:MAG: hypothetical protein IH991_12045, partial [Planctomycetes bacterium]|nr:hypothetical protein [Planctomycetota bacterium]
GVVYAQAAQTSAFRLPPSPRDATEMELLWQATASRGRRTPSPVWHKGLMYGVTTNGILDVTDTKTGEVVYRKRLDIGNNVYSSATSAGDYIFLSSTRGDTIVLKAGRKYDEVARNKLESFGSNPVFAGKRMYIRGQKHLYCIGE